MNPIKREDPERFTKAQKNRATEIALLVSNLSEPDQDKIYYMIMGLEVLGGQPTPKLRAYSA